MDSPTPDTPGPPGQPHDSGLSGLSAPSDSVLFVPFIRADRRKIRYEPQPEAMAVVERLAPRVKQDLIDLAKAFERIDRTTAYVGLGCASIGEFAIRQGLSPFLGRTLRFVGRAFLAFPWVEPALREGQFGFDQAESLGVGGSAGVGDLAGVRAGAAGADAADAADAAGAGMPSRARSRPSPKPQRARIPSDPDPPRSPRHPAARGCR